MGITRWIDRDGRVAWAQIEALDMTTAAHSRFMPQVVAGAGLILALLAGGTALVTFYDTAPDIGSLGAVLLLAGLAEIGAGLVLRRHADGAELLLLAGLSAVVAGLLLSGQTDDAVARLSRSHLGTVPAYKVVMIWLFARAIVQAAYCLIRGHHRVGFWLNAFVDATLGMLLLAKIPSVSLAWALFGFNREFLSILALAVASALMSGAAVLVGLWREAMSRKR